MQGLFDAYRDADLTLDELAQASSRISRKLELQSGDRRVRSLNERTIRYYQGRGLLDPPARSGRQARYSLLHLLQVLTIRRLQVEGCSLEAIKQLIDSGELPWQSTSNLERAIQITGRTIAASSSQPQIREELGDVVESLSSERMSIGFAASEMETPPPARDSLNRDEWRALEGELVTRLERRMETIAAVQIDRRLDSLLPRLETMLEKLLDRKLENDGRKQVRRDVHPGVSVIVDPSRVKDPDAVLSRIERAMTDDG